jgi:lipoate-protein ligase B
MRTGKEPALPAVDVTRRAVLLNYNRLAYEPAWALQRALREARFADRRADTLILLEHEPVFTIGRTGQERHWGGDETLQRRSGCPVVHVERGGSVTYHGPGQLVGYPILRLARFCTGPKAYMHMLGEVLIRTLAAWDISARWGEPSIGVWVGRDRPAKIAAMGVRVERGVTMHGFALNVTVDLRPFDLIVPCGLDGAGVTSMARVLGHEVEVAAVRTRLATSFAEVFGLEWVEDPGVFRSAREDPDAVQRDTSMAAQQMS